MRNGLEALAALAEAPEIVLIHDAARPFVDAGARRAAPSAPARAHGAAVPGLPLTDTVKQVDADRRGDGDAGPRRAAQRADAASLRLSADPRRASRAPAPGAELTDDGMVAEAAGHNVHVFAGDPANFKLTTAEDFVRAQSAIARRSLRHPHRPGL